MGRIPLQSLQSRTEVAQLLALNALFDAAREGDAAREAAATLQSAQQILANSKMDPLCDALLSGCYTALMEGSERPPRLS